MPTTTDAQKKATANYRAKNKERVAELNKKHFRTWYENPENRTKHILRTQILHKKRELREQYGDEIYNMVVSKDQQHILISFKNDYHPTGEESEYPQYRKPFERKIRGRYENQFLLIDFKLY